jgi:CRP-like cAMP-binding protein/SAM-dependent methyltransferase
MQSANVLLETLTDAESRALVAVGKERSAGAGDVVIEAGAPVTSLVVVLDGVLAVYSGPDRRTRLARLGPGDIVGDMSLVERRLPTEWVVAEEPSRLLDIAHADIDRVFDGDNGFRARLYLGLAKVLSRRLRIANSQAAAAAGPVASRDGQATWRRVEEAISALKVRLHAADDEALKHGRLQGRTAYGLVREFLQLFEAVEDQIGDAAPENARVKDEIGVWLQRELLPYVALTDVCERMYSKPRGYAGDYATIAKIYENVPGGTGRLGPTIDRAFLEGPPSAAVRNRRAILTDEITATVGRTGNGPARVTSLACGPAAEVFDAFGQLSSPNQLRMTLVDIDLQALAYVADKRDAERLQKQIAFSNENLIALAMGRTETAIRDQDLVYSIGLIDYFSDALVVRLINAVHAMLKPGGRVMLGNFHPRNRCKAFMDHVLEWRLTHRTEADLDRLFQRSVFGRPSTSVRFEAQRINLFAECVKA